MAAGDVAPEYATGGNTQFVAEALIQLDVFRQQNVLHCSVARAFAQQQFEATDTAQVVVLQLDQGIIIATRLILAVNLGDHDLVLAECLINCKHRA
jgi:hypothetical protein